MSVWRGFVWVFPFRSNYVLSICLFWGRSVTGEHIGLCITGWDSRFRWMKKGSQEAIIWARFRLPRFKSAPVLAKSSPPFCCFNRHLHYCISSLIILHSFIPHSLDSFPLLSLCHLNSHITNSRVVHPWFPPIFPSENAIMYITINQRIPLLNPGY